MSWQILWLLLLARGSGTGWPTLALSPLFLSCRGWGGCAELWLSLHRVCRKEEGFKPSRLYGGWWLDEVSWQWTAYWQHRGDTHRGWVPVPGKEHREGVKKMKHEEVPSSLKSCTGSRATYSAKQYLNTEGVLVSEYIKKACLFSCMCACAEQIIHDDGIWATPVKISGSYLEKMFHFSSTFRVFSF